MRDFTAPLRLTWDLPEDPGLAAELWRRIVDGRVLLAEVHVTSRSLGSHEVDLRVHDVFLAETLGLSPFRRYAGCQAGGALAHLTERGQIVACRTLPQVLGNLLESSLSEVWADEARRSLRERLSETPSECSTCSLAPSCAGGCRGLSPRLGRDPSCAGARSGNA